MDESFSKMWIFCGLFALGLFTWQHVGRICGWNFRPSSILNLWASGNENFWTTIGELLAIVGSFYHYFYFYAQELAISLYELVHPILRLVASPCYIIYGFLSTMATFAKPHLVLFGTIILVSLGLGTTYWYYQDFFEKPEVLAIIGLILVFGIICAIYADGEQIVKWLNDAAEKLCPKVENPKKKPKQSSHKNSPASLLDQEIEELF